MPSSTIRSLDRGRLFILICTSSLVVGLLVTKQAVTAAGNTIIVNSTSDVTNSSDGLCTLREAITAANANTASGAVVGECAAGSTSDADTIDLTGLTGSITLTSVLPNLSSDMLLNGPGPGTLTIQRGNLNFAVFTVSSSATAAISGLAVQGGSPSTNFGILNSGTLNLSDCTVSGFGRGVGNGQGTLTISNCTVSGNLNGGGISNSQGTLNLINSVVSGNDSRGAFGPGIDNSGTLNVTNSIITNNLGHNAISNGFGGTATFTNSTISNNGERGLINHGNLSMTGGSIVGNSNGGAILGGIAMLNGVTVSNNSNTGGTGFGGGGLFINGSAVTVINCLVTNNSTTSDGGGIRNGGGKATIINTTVSGNNSVGRGGGVNTVDGGLANFVGVNLTITGNRAGFGGGVFRESGPMKFKNSIIAANFFQNGTSPSDIGGTVDASSSFNLVGVGGSGGLSNGVNNNQVGVNPLLGPLANNGGPTLTHALLSNSPALDAGDNCVTEVAHCGEPTLPQLTTDQRRAGFNRMVDGPDADASSVVDIGAYETQLPLASLADPTTNEDTQLVVAFDAGDTSTITSISATSSNSTLVPNDSAHLSSVLAGSTGVITINPAANLFGTTNVTVTVNRTGGPEVKVLMVTVNSSNDAPSFTKGSNYTLLEDAGAQTVQNWATNISAGPADEADQVLTFEVTGNTNAALFSSGPAISSTGTLTYTPAANANGTATVTIVLKDNGGTANAGVDTSAAQTFIITIITVNDAPSFVKGPDQVVNEDTGRFVGWATNVSTGALNEAQALNFQVTDNTNPTLFSSGPAIGFTGNLSFTPAPNLSGSATITIILKDNGGTANGGVDTSAPQTFTITVTPVNDRPVNTVPVGQSVLKNGSLIFSVATFNQVSIADVDAGTALVQVALNVSNGVLTLNGTAGLNFSVGNGNANPAMTFTGSISDINVALNGMRFAPTNDFVGTAQVQIQTNDLGNTGSGGALSDSDFVNIAVAENVLQFSAPNFWVVEGSEFATITVTRQGSAGALSVRYSSFNSSAAGGASCVSGADYVTTTGTLTWAAGETNPKTFTIPICDDMVSELQENLLVILDNLMGNAVLGRAFANVNIVDAGPPILLVEDLTNRAIALDSPTFTRDPFSVTNPNNLSTDTRRRISLFAWRLALRPTDTAANLTVTAEDDQGRVYPLTVEYVGAMDDLVLVTQVIVRLPDDVIGAPRDLMVSVQLRGTTSNKGVIKIAAP